MSNAPLPTDRYAVDDPCCRPSSPDFVEAITDELLAHGEFSSGWNNRLNAREAARVVIDMVRTFDAAQGSRNGALKLLADLFSESIHETWTKEEIVNIIEDVIRLGSPHSSTPRATPIDHSNEECPNFPGCHCVDHCCDGWKHPSPEISSTDRPSLNQKTRCEECNLLAPCDDPKCPNAGGSK